jgi:hypothetical protein
MRFCQMIFFGTLAFCSQTALPVLAQPRKPLPKWEYKIVNLCDGNDQGLDIQQLGQEGWELVNAAKEGWTENSSGCQKFYFKRLGRAGSKPKVSPQPLAKPPSKCTLRLDKSPDVKGIHLGSTEEELFKLFPKLADDFKYQTQSYPKDWTGDKVYYPSVPNLFTSQLDIRV